jgi:hypothetical protein
MTFFCAIYTYMWSKSHAAHIKTFINDGNSMQFDWINKRSVAATVTAHAGHVML